MRSNLATVVIIVLICLESCCLVTSFSRGTRDKNTWGPNQDHNEAATTLPFAENLWQPSATTPKPNNEPTITLTGDPETCVPNQYNNNEEQVGHYGHNRSPRILHSSQSSKYYPPTLTIKLAKDLNCFKVFDTKNCHEQGASIEFLNAKSDTHLRRNREGAGNPDRLLNLNLVPASFQSCREPKSSTKEACNSGLFVKLESTTGVNATVYNVNSEACLDLPSHQSTPQIKRPQAKLMLDVTSLGDDNNICLELFSVNKCSTEETFVRFRIPYESVLRLKNEINSALSIWEFYSSSTKGVPQIDTDVKSIRKCSNCRGNDKAKPAYFASSKNQNEHSWARCEFKTCTLVPEKMNDTNSWPSEEAQCFYFFNDTNCKFNPATKDNMTVNSLETLLGKYKAFHKWALASCADNPDPPTCKETVYRHKDLKDVLQSMYSPGDKKWQTIFLVVVVSLVVLMLIVIVVMVILLRRKKQRIRAIRKTLTPVQRQCHMQAPPRNLAVHQSDAIEENDYVNDVTGLRALCASFSEGFEIPRDRINIGNIRNSTADIIGVGEFSIAFKGKLEPEGRMVAVKTLKSGQATNRSIKCALRECQHFKQLGKNPRILEFLGVCTENVKKGELFVVMAWCQNGSLRGFLIQQKNHFVNLVQDGEWVNDEKLEKALNSTSYIEAGPPPSFNTLQLFKWCYEVADVMEFLAMRKIVHVSLSARNVLLDNNFATKLSDFHMAKTPGDALPSWTLNTMNKTILNKERCIPWRYYSIESLVDDVFSIQSDVWTFGVFMWEVFSMGATPYPEYSYGSEFTLCIKHGYRLQAPNSAPLECFQLMLTCWYDASEKRPTFSKVKERLDEMTPKKNVTISPGPFQIIRSLSKLSDQ